MKRFILAIVFVFCCSLGMTPPAEAGLISKEQEIEMGRQTAMQLEAKYGVVQDYGLAGNVSTGSVRAWSRSANARIWNTALRC